ncbi:uncharacterized protein LOC115623650 [Scaptodrosophila lebanonensis]|uniref:Uncharacterized protein LOC115623650 n=1 Tax=Drosophila lebanonensis TaxID=7225 RepID=A0A6J2TFS4_DROLE|nr:uncharacterized protein LOC115623650 [Scaptodrosophila lebanonensis]
MNQKESATRTPKINSSRTRSLSGLQSPDQLDEDCFSNYSRASTHSEQIQPRSRQSSQDPPIRVRDMINLYNFATEKNQELSHAKSIYFGQRGSSKNLNTEGALNENDEPEMGDQLENECLSNMGLDHDNNNSVSSCRLNPSAPNFRVTTTDGQTSVRQTTEKGAEPVADSVEKSYQSKTTIRRTEQGVRIIIDIFFDKNNAASCVDMVGSRVETDIPESRILADFQQQALALNVQPSDTNV